MPSLFINSVPVVSYSSSAALDPPALHQRASTTCTGYLMGEQHRTVSVIDDDEGVRTSLARLLRSANFNVETFASVNDFLKEWDGDRHA